MNNKEDFILDGTHSAQVLIIDKAKIQLLNWLSVVLTISLVILDTLLIVINKNLSIVNFIFSAIAIGVTGLNLGIMLEKKYHQFISVKGSYSNIITLGLALKFNKLKCVIHTVQGNDDIYRFIGKNGKQVTCIITSF